MEGKPSWQAPLRDMNDSTSSRFSGGSPPDRRQELDEQDQPQDEHPPTSVDIAEAASGDKHRSVGKSVARDDQLDLRDAGIQVALQFRNGDVHDEEIEHRQ